jgi:nucleoside-diphosphate-sugar epimerase
MFRVTSLSLFYLLISFSFLLAKRVAIFGATGRTGREVVTYFLNERDDVSLTCIVKDFGKARELFGPDTARLSVLPCDVVVDSAAKITRLIKGSDAVVFAAANSKISLMGPYQIDYLGAKKTIDACVDAGVPKFVLLSSILANGLEAGQALNPQYLLLNSFGGILLMKRQAELYLQQQNRVRPFAITEPDFIVLSFSYDM